MHKKIIAILVGLVLIGCTRSVKSPILSSEEATQTAVAKNTIVAIANLTQTAFAPTSTSTPTPTSTNTPEPVNTKTPSPTAEYTIYIPNIQNGKSFSDIDEEDPLADYMLAAVYEYGVLKPCSENPLLFCPDGQVSRDEMASAVCAMKYEEDDLQKPLGHFTDVPKDDPLAPCVEKLYQEGIIAGCSETPATFCRGPLTMAEAAVFFLRGVHGGDWEPPSYNGWPWGFYDENWQARWGEALIRGGYYPIDLFPRLRGSDPATRRFVSYVIYQYSENNSISETQ
jgi:hypothetical protein